MFLLGHSCWSYLISKFTGRRLRVNLPLWMALLAGVLPDFDIYFHGLIEHHTITHSLLLLGPICVVLAWRYRRLGIAFSAGIFSHLFTDSLVGSIPIFYPLSQYNVGLNLGLPSLADTLLEMGALATVIVYVLQNGDYLLFTQRGRQSLPIAVPLAAIVTLTLLFAGDNNLPLVTLAFARRALTAITVGHLILGGTLSVGTLQGILAYAHKKQHANPISKEEAH